MKMDALTFRKVLSGAIVLLIVATGASYYLLSGLLKAKATEVNRINIDVELSSTKTASLKRLQTELDKYKDVIPRAKELVASSEDFKYQDQVIRDINTLANEAGITVTGYTFADGTASSSGGATAPAPQGGAEAAPGPATGALAAKKVALTITMKSPIPYDSYLRFLRYIEHNVTRLQVTGINLTPDPTDKAKIINPSVGIEIFVRQ